MTRPLLTGAHGKPLPHGRLNHLHFTSRLSDTVFDNLALAKPLRHAFTASWTVMSGDLSTVGNTFEMDVRWWEEEGLVVSVILESADALLRIGLLDDTLNVRGLVALGGRADLERRLRDHFPERVPEGELSDEIEVRFWFWDPTRSQPARRTRVLKAPRWGEVQNNYAAMVRSRLEDMASATHPEAGGQLILWHGDPGTGKTHAIKALGREWSKWCSFEYITDPEMFFGSASYLIEAMLEEPVRDQTWRLLILEDTGELMLPDARSRMGQGLSRLLNVVDGLIGQGLKTLLLITTNEPLEKLHPAVSRPGRSASVVEFEPFTEAEAWEWASDNGLELESAPPRHLSDLFALKESFSNKRRAPRSALGFANIGVDPV